MPRKNYCLGVFDVEEKSYLFCRSLSTAKTFQVHQSNDGLNFELLSDKAQITSTNNKESIGNTHHFAITKIGKIYFLSYYFQVGERTYLYGAYSLDLISWQKIGEIDSIREPGRLVANFVFKSNFVLYYGCRFIDVALSAHLKTWEDTTGATIKLPGNVDGKFRVKIGYLAAEETGIRMVYFLYPDQPSSSAAVIRSVIFDKKEPKRILPGTEQLIWRQSEEIISKQLDPIGLLKRENSFMSYWQTKEGVMQLIHPVASEVKRNIFSLPLLDRLVHNPILKPIKENEWESVAVFNPTAVQIGDKVHLLYRAVGNSNVSVIGYACSKDGIHIDERLAKPVYVANCQLVPDLTLEPVDYKSGRGTYGGAEDPRVTQIGDRLYLFYTDFNGWDSVRIAFTSISEKDFLKKNWNWDKPIFISPPGMPCKNACMLPEKINGKYVIFHRLHLGCKVKPNICIDFVPDLEFKNRWLEGHHQINVRKGYWDSAKVGLGAPPIKTKDGWLMIYQGVGEEDSSRYKMGAMLLETDNPSKVIYRCEEPIMEPTEFYENYGLKFGVIYPCGTVVKDGNLLVYYGGSDTYSCLAIANLDIFLKQLKGSGKPKLQPVINKINLPKL